MLDSTTKLLFSPFQREVATPVRRRIRSQKDFERFISTNNSKADCYCDLFPYPFNGTLDKVYFDFDGIHGMHEALPFAQVFYVSLLKRGLTVIPVASGKKGFNIYVLFKPKRYKEAKQLLHDVSYSLIIDEFGPVTPMTINDDGVEHPTLVNDDGIIYIDPKVIGDVRRFSRIPNTLRPPENKAWCTYLPPEDFLRMSVEDVYNHIKSPHTYDYNLDKKLLTMDEIPIHEAVREVSNSEVIAQSNLHFKENEYLRRVIRPSLYKHILQSEPHHSVRVAVTVDLLEFLSPDEVFDIFSKLGWVDFDPEITKYQIISCVGLKRFSNRRLKELGIV